MHDQACAIGYDLIESCLEQGKGERKNYRAPKPANQAEPGTYLLLVGDRDRTAPVRVALRRRGRGVTQHSAGDVHRAQRLLGSLQYDAIALFWDVAITVVDLQELGERAGATQRIMFSRDAPEPLMAQAEALGWIVSSVNTASDARSSIEDLIDSASRTRQSAGVPHYEVPGFGHLDMRPVVRALTESRGLTPTEATVLAGKLACWSMDKRLSDMGCSRRLIERYEGELRDDLGLREVTLWLIAGLDILAREGRLGEVGFGQGKR